MLYAMQNAILMTIIAPYYKLYGSNQSKFSMTSYKYGILLDTYGTTCVFAIINAQLFIAKLWWLTNTLHITILSIVINCYNYYGSV